VGGIYRRHGYGYKRIKKYNLKEREHLGDIEIDDKIILKLGLRDML
jgi:hypothetical protein